MYVIRIGKSWLYMFSVNNLYETTKRDQAMLFDNKEKAEQNCKVAQARSVYPCTIEEVK